MDKSSGLGVPSLLREDLNITKAANRCAANRCLYFCEDVPVLPGTQQGLLGSVGFTVVFLNVGLLAVVCTDVLVLYYVVKNDMDKV